MGRRPEEEARARVGWAGLQRLPVDASPDVVELAPVGASLEQQAPQSVPLVERSESRFAREQFILLMQLAYSGELGAAQAYVGHRHSLRKQSERAELGKIIRDELRHRHNIIQILAGLGARPSERRERKMAGVGWTISVFCHLGGWFFPMYGAAMLEAQNIVEYELAARLAHNADLDAYVETCLEMAEVEWDHELYFRSQATSHFLWRLMPKWTPPPPRAAIRRAFADFVATSDKRTLPPVHVPWLIR